MHSEETIPSSLARLASILRAGKLRKHADDIAELRRLALSSDETDQEKFRREITTSKLYWLGMGTIADVTFSTKGVNDRFLEAYYELADACNGTKYESIYSRDVASTLGSLLKKGKDS